MIHTNFTFSELIGTFMDAFKNSTELSDFFVSNYDKECTYCLGNDERNEFGREEAPFLVLVPISIDGGITTRTVSYSFDIDIGILDPVFNDHQLENVKDMRGFHKLDEAVNVVMNLIVEHASKYNAIADDVNIIYDNSVNFPLHIATLNFSVEVPTVMGAKNTLGGN